MIKDAFYFSHDSNARQDDKIIALRMKLRWEGYGLYWAIVEKLREASDYTLPRDYNAIAFDLRTEAKIIKSIIEDFGLFEFTEDGKGFYSERMMRNMEEMNKKSQKARDSINKRWEKQRENKVQNTNEIRTYNDRNTKKRKEIKVKESIPPISPQGEDVGMKSTDWKTDFKIYLKELRETYKVLTHDKEWISEREKLNPGIDILLTMEKSCIEFWATEEGWENKKKSKVKTINWKSTLTKAISQPMNKVYKDRFSDKPPVKHPLEPLEPAI